MARHFFHHGVTVACLAAFLAGCGGSSGGDSKSSEPGLTLSTPGGGTSESGAGTTFTVVLDAVPTAEVTVAVSSSDTTEVSFDTGQSLDFTRSNWDEPQTVELVGVDDQLVDGDQTVTITATAGSTGGYDGESASVTITNADYGDMWPSRDTTLYEYTGMPPAPWSNGGGQYMFVGRIGPNGQAPLGDRRRALLAFDVAGSVPAGATILGATLVMNVSMARDVVGGVSLHRMQADWGEGTADAPGNEAGGNGGQPPFDGSTLPAAQTGDATWTHSMHNMTQWTMDGAEGGDYEGVASATQNITGAGVYTWDSGTLAQDVQLMLDDPANNFGWMLIGDEVTQRSVKRFDTSEGDVLVRPVLSVDYFMPP